MAYDDWQLAARAVGGDKTALEVLYRRHVDTVWRYAWLRAQSRHDAAEIVQEVFLRVVRSIHQFEGRSAFTTWLFAITRSVAIERTRREQRTRIHTVDDGVLRFVPADETTADSARDHAPREAVRKAVANLPGAQRDAIVLCELSGFSIREAGEVLGWGESRVKVTLHRARRRLRDELREHMNDDVKDEARDRQTTT